MSKSPAMSHRMRLLKAFAIVLAILAVAPGVDALARIAVPLQIAEAANEGLDASALLSSSDPYAALDRIEEAVAAGDVSLPSWFHEEIGFLPDARDIRVSGDGSVVGYSSSGDVSGVLSRLVEHMKSAGWRPVPLGELDGATFVKSTGACTWALATCTQVGSDTSVVVRCKLP